MTYAAMKRKAKAAIAAYVEGKQEVRVSEVREHVEAESGIDYAASTIGTFLKGVGFQRDPATSGAIYRRAP